MKIAYAFCGSFCTHAQSLQALERLVSAGAEVLPIFPIVCQIHPHASDGTPTWHCA